MVTQLTKLLRLYSCNDNMALQITGKPAETCWWEYCEQSKS